MLSSYALKLVSAQVSHRYMSGGGEMFSSASAEQKVITQTQCLFCSSRSRILTTRGHYHESKQVHTVLVKLLNNIALKKAQVTHISTAFCVLFTLRLGSSRILSHLPSALFPVYKHMVLHHTIVYFFLYCRPYLFSLSGPPAVFTTFTSSSFLCFDPHRALY